MLRKRIRYHVWVSDTGPAKENPLAEGLCAELYVVQRRAVCRQGPQAIRHGARRVCLGLHVPLIGSERKAYFRTLAASHGRRGLTRIAQRAVDLTPKAAPFGVVIQRLAGLATEQRRRVISDPRALEFKPPVSVVELVLDFQLIAWYSNPVHRIDDHAGIDICIVLDPAGVVR